MPKKLNHKRQQTHKLCWYKKYFYFTNYHFQISIFPWACQHLLFLFMSRAGHTRTRRGHHSKVYWWTLSALSSKPSSSSGGNKWATVIHYCRQENWDRTCKGQGQKFPSVCSGGAQQKCFSIVPALSSLQRVAVENDRWTECAWIYIKSISRKRLEFIVWVDIIG